MDTVSPLTPDARSFGEPAGTPVQLADGNTWHLSAFVPRPGLVWDRLYDDNVVRGKYKTADVFTAAYRLLRDNYRLTPEEAFDLFRGVEVTALVSAVEKALFGPPSRELAQKWSTWVEASLAANGIDPASVDPSQLRDVLGILVATGRAIPEEQFIATQIGMEKRRALLNFGKD